MIKNVWRVKLERTINIERIEQIAGLFGNLDENIKEIEARYNVSVTSHSNQIKIKGEPENVEHAVRAIEGLLKLISITEQP